MMSKLNDIRQLIADNSISVIIQKYTDYCMMMLITYGKAIR